MTNPDHTHYEFAALQAWTTEAAQLFTNLIDRMEALEHEVVNLRARVAEWEQSPR